MLDQLYSAPFYMTPEQGKRDQATISDLERFYERHHGIVKAGSAVTWLFMTLLFVIKGVPSEEMFPSMGLIMAISRFNTFILVVYIQQ